MKESDTTYIVFAIALGLLAIPISSVYAINFVDHTGYTPDWAQTLGSYQTLARCSEIGSENTADDNWCLEWETSVVDQGGASQAQPVRPTTDMVERTCTVNVVCVFPNEFIKYVGSYYDIFTHQNKIQFANVYFGDLVGDNKIMVSMTGTQLESSTDVLDMNTGTLSNQQYNLTNKGFGYVEPIPVKNSLRGETGLFDCGADCKITFEKMNVKGKTRTILVSHLDEYGGTFVENRYDNDTGVWLAGIMTSQEDNKTVSYELHIVDSNIYDHPTVITASNVQPEPTIVGIPDQDRTINKTSNNQNLTLPKANAQTQYVNQDSSVTNNVNNENNTGNLIVGLILFVVVPALIIILVSYKIKKYLSKRRNNKLQKKM